MNTDRFKFRAWDTHCNRMRYEEDYAVVPDTGKPHWIHDQELIQGEAAQLILMQCTGLKDVKGKLIYEGDILRWVSYEGFEVGYIKGIYVVKWNDEGFYELHDPFSDEYWPINDTEFDNIIGNIYEHIHLLPDYETVQE